MSGLGSYNDGSGLTDAAVDRRRREENLPASAVSALFAAQFCTIRPPSPTLLCPKENDHHKPQIPPFPPPPTLERPKTLTLVDSSQNR